MGKYFGTDGFRGEANVNLTAEQAFQTGVFLGAYYTRQKLQNGDTMPAKIVVGKDTRRSSYMFEYAIIAGIISAGANAYTMHVTTTPSVAYIVKTDRFDCGVMISASHNPYFDNGIKLINGDGEKMDEDTILLLENFLDGKSTLFTIETAYAKREKIGKTVDYESGRNRYIAYLISLGLYSLQGKKVGLDCANGSAWKIAKSVFEALGASTYLLNAQPNGVNINLNGGATHLKGLQAFVLENGLDVGFAYDGDGDRCLCVDEKGNEVTGDGILYLAGRYMQENGELHTNTVVTTVMSNLGLYKTFDRLGIAYEKTDVGDKYVYENMAKYNHSLGGEQSGHIIFSKYATTGDGILTSLKVMEVMLCKGEPLSSLTAGLTIYPQVLENVPVYDKNKVMADGAVAQAVKEAEEELNGEGRILVRASGTESVVRIMVEAKTKEVCQALVARIKRAVKKVDFLQN